MLAALMLLAGFAGTPVVGGGTTFFRPYQRPDLDLVYNLLFCDDPELFRPKGAGAGLTVPFSILLAKKPAIAELQKIAADEAAESRLRLVAYHRLRAAKAVVPKGQLLGVVVEVPLDKGLDVLGVFADGRMRYINHAGKLAVFEALPAGMKDKHAAVLKASQAAIKRIGPWDDARVAPPPRGSVRLSFLVSDGLYFGEGPMEAISKDPIGGPVLGSASQLLAAIVDAGTAAP
jgi:hypothetical protein